MDHQDTLERLLDDLPVGPAPIDALLASRTAVRRRRRTALGAAVATACLVVGVGVLASEPDPPRRETSFVGDPARTPLRAEVRGGWAPTGHEPGTAVWDASNRTLVYVSTPAWSSSCPPAAAAATDGDGAVTIDLVREDDAFGMVCTADAGVATVTVHGLERAPASLTVSAPGETGPVPIVPLGSDAPKPWEAMRLPCAETRLVALDIPGPGQPTPEEAVRPYLGAHTIHLVSTSGRKATVTAVNSAGEVRRSYAVRLVDDGWWPDGYTECVGPS